MMFGLRHVGGRVVRCLRGLSTEASDGVGRNSGESLALISGTPDEHAVRQMIICRPGRVATQQGRGSKTKLWTAKFEKYEGKDRWTNPLMGWTSTGDPLTNANMHFPTKEAAIAYAERNGYKYRVDDPEEAKENVRNFGAFGRSMVHQWRHQGVPVYAGDDER